eukprot:scaffold4155_cov165-Amphora_coffeaeformis.AAC.5
MRQIFIGLVALVFSSAHGLASHRYRARVAYEGTSFQGFQIQEGSTRRTVQGDIEQVLSQRLNEPIRIVGAGRTDSGVHARGQAIHFDCKKDLSEQELDLVQNSVEKMLPKDVALWNLQRAPPPLTKIINGVSMEKEWNVIYDSTSKLYSYRINVAPTMDPLERYHRWHPDRVQRWFDKETFARLLKCYEGDHDFRAFASDVERLEKQMGGKVGTVRTVYKVKIVEEGGVGNLRIEFLLKGALYKQVRNLVGTALEVCRGRMGEDFFQSLVHNNGELTRDDNFAKPAPPEDPRGAETLLEVGVGGV